MADQPLLAEALQLMWSGSLGSSTWVGYLLHLFYALGIDEGYSNDMCEAIGYVYYAVDGMSIMTTFAQPTEETTTTDESTDTTATECAEDDTACQEAAASTESTDTSADASTDTSADTSADTSTESTA